MKMEDEYKEYLRGLRKHKKSMSKSGIAIILSTLALGLNFVLIFIEPYIIRGLIFISIMLWLIYCIWDYGNEKEQYSEWTYKKYGKRVFEYAKRAEQDKL